MNLRTFSHIKVRNLQRPDGVLPIEVKAEVNVQSKVLAAFVNGHLHNEAPPQKACGSEPRPSGQFHALPSRGSQGERHAQGPEDAHKRLE